MDISEFGKYAVRTALARIGYSVRRISREEKMYVLGGYDADAPLPAGAEQALRHDNPRLRELEQRYQRFDSPVCQHSQWRAELHPDALDLRYFRGDNAYMWQYRRVRDFTRLRYYLYARYIRDLDTRRLLGTRLTEDGMFGCFAFHFDAMPSVSRDLLDSINELYFLDRHWQFFHRSEAQILDIGAGYGRLAHRALAAAEGVQRYWCIDAIPRSTFLCEYYLHHRGCSEAAGGRAKVVPLDEMQKAIPAGSIDLAVNIHSFSEMSYEAIEGWISWLTGLGVPHLMIVPNEPDLLSKELDGGRRGYREIIERAGYTEKACEPTIRDEDVRQMFGVNDFMFLFERRGSAA